MRVRAMIDQEELRRRYVEERQTIVVIAAQIGCSAATISNLLRRYGIPTRSGRFSRRDVPRALLVQLYSVERLPIRQIAERLGVSHGTIGNRRKAYNIPERPRVLQTRTRPEPT
jgi:TyrR family helix-turn-helix protein